MSEPCCTFIKPDGQPCAARPLPGRDFCLFHDPEQAEALAQARRKGGSAPRRRLRRYPRLLDYQHIAELLSELFMDAVNAPDAVDPKRLLAITHVARTLLKAVGTPTPDYFEHDQHAESAPSSDHLLRVYPPLSPDVLALLEAELSAAQEPEPASPTTPQPPPAPTPPEHPHAATPTPPVGPPSPDPHAPSDPSDPSEPPPINPNTQPDHELVEKQGGEQDNEQDDEQDREQDPNKCGTGHPATDTAQPLPLNTRTPEHLNTQTPEPLAAQSPQPPNRCETGPSATVGSIPSDRSVPPAGDSLPPHPFTPSPLHPHAPWPAPDRPTPGHVIVDVPLAPAGPNLR